MVFLGRVGDSESGLAASKPAPTRLLPNRASKGIGTIPYASRALPKFESYGMLETTAFGGWKAKEAIEWLHGIGRLVSQQAAKHST
jgi:hypothetical protein